MLSQLAMLLSTIRGAQGWNLGLFFGTARGVCSGIEKLSEGGWSSHETGDVVESLLQPHLLLRCPQQIIQ